MKGTLGEGVLPSILRELYVGRKTGVLRFAQGTARRTIRFVKGSIIHAASEPGPCTFVTSCRPSRRGEAGSGSLGPLAVDDSTWTTLYSARVSE